MKTYSRTKLANYIASNVDSSELAEHVAAYLIEVGKTSDLDSIMRDVQEIRATDQGVVEVTARSAFPLDADEKQQIEVLSKAQYPGAKQVILHELIDKTLLGGATLSFAQANLDLTIRSKLNRLREASK